MVKQLVNLSTLSAEETDVVPMYAGREMTHRVPKFVLPEGGMEPRTTYNLIHDELMLDGNARLNLATFVTIWDGAGSREADGRVLRQEHDR